MVKDEEPFLNTWFQHYLTHFVDVGFIIIDHASTRPVKQFLATDWPKLKADVIELPAFPFDADYKAIALSALGGLALGAFHSVIVTDADEIVVPLKPLKPGQTLKALFDADEGDYIAPIGMEFVHNSLVEPEFDFMKPLLDQRGYFRFHSAYSKPAIWRKSDAAFSAGQHRMDKPFKFSSDLGLAHLKYVDESYSRNRQGQRNQVTYSATHLAKGRGGAWSAKVSDDWGGVYKSIKAGAPLPDAKATYEAFLRQLMIPVEGKATHSLKLSSPITRYSDM